MDELTTILAGTLHWSLAYDDHASIYQTIDEWANDMLAVCERAEDERAEIEACRRGGHVWHLQVYPTTPVGFYCCYAPTFEALLERARILRPALDIELGRRGLKS